MEARHSYSKRLRERTAAGEYGTTQAQENKEAERRKQFVKVGIKPRNTLMNGRSNFVKQQNRPLAFP